MRCLFRRFKGYPHSVTKVLQTLLRYLDRQEVVGNQHVAPASRQLSCGRLAHRVMEASANVCDSNLLRGQDAGATKSGATKKLVFRQLFHGLEKVCRLGQDRVFQVGMVRDEYIHCGHPAYRGIQVLE